MLEELTSHLVARPSNKTFLLHDLATCISAAIDADQVRPLAIGMSDTLVNVPAPGESLHPLHRGPHL